MRTAASTIALATAALSAFLANVSGSEPSLLPTAPCTADEHTLLLAHFDRQCAADFARGGYAFQGRGRLIPEGRFGAAVRLEGGEKLALAGGDNFPGGSGTVEFWLRPDWNGDDGQTQRVFAASGGEGDYLNINKLSSGRFGAGISGKKPGSDAKYCRADADVKAWKAGQWHHVAVCWDKEELSLWIDGALAAKKQDAVAPQHPVKAMSLAGGAVIDELHISRVARYTPDGLVIGKPLSPAELQAARRAAVAHFVEPPDVYRLASPPSAAVAGMAIVAKPCLEDLEPAMLSKAVPAEEIRLFASPGEIEPATLVILAAAELRDLQVTVADLRCESHVLPAAAITVRRVVCTPMRRLYTAPAEQSEIVNRFLPRWRPLDVPAGEFREVWLSCDIPTDASPGVYEGSVQVRHAGGERFMPLRVEVLPIRLVEHPRKQLASYYRMERQLFDPPRVLRELGDMRAHGVRHLFSGLHVRYSQRGDAVTIDLHDMEQGLALIRQAGFRDATIVVDSGLPTLARIHGLSAKDLAEAPDSQADKRQFLADAKRGVEAVLALGRKFPELRLVLTHLDEIFNEERLPLYIELSKAVRQVPEARLYITFHTRDDKHDQWRQLIDPLVDIRCHHGYTFEWWLARGHTIDEYCRELEAAGDEAWFYHNARGVHFTALWSRIINGLYLWASPFRAHCPWIYQAYQENPFDDTDGGEKAHDFGMSFPGPDDPADLVPTRVWEAMREGADDLRYLATLERAIAAARGQKPQEAAEAEKFVDRLRGMVHGARLEDPATAAAAGAETGQGPIDLDTGLRMGKGSVGSAAEAPLIQSLSKRLGDSGSQALRRQMAEHIVRLAPPIRAAAPEAGAARRGSPPGE